MLLQQARARRLSTVAELSLARVCRVPGSARPSPSLFSYPGLTARPWHSREFEAFAPWVQQLEAATPAITQEYLALRASNAPSDYVPEGTDHGQQLHTGPVDWHWSTLIDRGRRRPDMWERCPQTTAALEAIPGLCEGDMPFAFAFFSTLKPHCRIAAHTAPCNLRGVPPTPSPPPNHPCPCLCPRRSREPSALWQCACTCPCSFLSRRHAASR